MSFTTTPFLFFYLPITLLLYFLTPQKYKNWVLTILSLLMYAWGNLFSLVILIMSILITYAAAYGIVKTEEKNPRTKLAITIIAIIINLGALVLFRYSGFINTGLTASLKLIHISSKLALPVFPLPLGISFFTFQEISYLIDLKNKRAKWNPSLIDFSLYIAFFPQLVAGPIIRYLQISDQLLERSVTITGFSNGLKRFIIGFFKKLVIADILAQTADKIFGWEAINISPGLAWLGVISYTLQIYIDFSAYTDMAIGLGKMFGFDLPENFNFPYIASSIRDFWDRWHITASNWFRFYLFSPIGRWFLKKWKGNHKLLGRLLTTLITMTLIGIWHGPDLNFIIWGALQGVLMVLETIFSNSYEKLPSPIKHIYTMFFVMIGWVFFRTNTISKAANYILAMFSFKSDTIRLPASMYFDNRILLTLILGILISLPLKTYFEKMFASQNGSSKNIFIQYGEVLGFIALLWIGIVYMISNSYNAFIYFQF